MKIRLRSRSPGKPPRIVVFAAVLCCLLGVLQAGGGFDAARKVIFEPARNASYQHGSLSLGYAQVQPKHQRVDCAVTACIALTFDDGPNPITTPLILDVLDRHHARASFFVVGSRIHGQEALMRRMFYGGHEIGNHSWSHGDFTAMPPQRIREEINMTQAAIVAAGVPAPTLFRPPYGAVDSKVRTHVPLTIAMWNIDPLDWKAKNVEQFKELMLRQAHPGGVLDLHDIYGTTAHSLEPAIIELQKHYTLVTFSELMNLQPGQPGEYYGR